jgi:hypothetical protein
VRHTAGEPWFVLAVKTNASPTRPSPLNVQPSIPASSTLLASVPFVR